MIINEVICEVYSYEDLTTVIFKEEKGGGKWDFQYTTAYKKGFKKHSRDKRVMDNLEKLIDHITSYDRVPPIESYPIEYNVHPIKKDKRFTGSMWAHIKGQKIGLLFYVRIDPNTNKPTIEFVHLGTHQEIGWS